LTYSKPALLAISYTDNVFSAFPPHSSFTVWYMIEYIMNENGSDSWLLLSHWWFCNNRWTVGNKTRLLFTIQVWWFFNL